MPLKVGDRVRVPAVDDAPETSGEIVSFQESKPSMADVYLDRCEGCGSEKCSHYRYIEMPVEDLQGLK